jgi:hypothetical protein
MPWWVLAAACSWVVVAIASLAATVGTAQKICTTHNTVVMPIEDVATPTATPTELPCSIKAGNDIEWKNWCQQNGYK